MSFSIFWIKISDGFLRLAEPKLHVLALLGARKVRERSISSFYLGTLRYKRKISQQRYVFKIRTSSQNSWSISWVNSWASSSSWPYNGFILYPSTETIPEGLTWPYFHQICWLIIFSLLPEFLLLFETYALVSTTLYSTGSLFLCIGQFLFLVLFLVFLYWFPSIGIAWFTHKHFLPNWRWCSQTISTSLTEFNYYLVSASLWTGKRDPLYMLI